MKKGFCLVFRCRMCGALFEEQYDNPKDFRGNRLTPEEFVEHLGAQESWIVSTHHCTPDSGSNPDTYGCGRLVGARIYKGAEQESSDDSGGGLMADGQKEKAVAPPSVAEVAKAATDAGMSYGRYVQMMHQKKAQEQPRPPVTTCCAPAPKRPEISEEE